MTLVELLLTNLAVIAGAMLLLWLISIPIRNASIVDIFWGPAFAHRGAGRMVSRRRRS